MSKPSRTNRVNTEGGYRANVVTISICVTVSIVIQILFHLPWTSVYDYATKKPPEKAAITHVSSKSLYLEEPFPLKPWKESNEVVLVKSSGDAPLDPIRVSEALAALTVARNFREKGHITKAKVIIEHALALAPIHPDVLAEYGHVYEEEENVIEADLCYYKALTYDPHHTKALERRRRTLPLVSMQDRKMLERIQSMKEKFTHLPASATLKKALRESYFLHVYHTVAIEGNTLSLGQTRSILETEMAVEGKSIREHNEVLGMDAALRFLNSSLLGSNEITLDDILEMHRRVVGHSDPSIAGRLRNTQVYVGRFTPIAPEYVREQMEDMVEWLNSPSTLDMDPVERAAIAHYKLVVVHPFVDGNGRTARLLLNLILMKSGFPPVILPVESRAKYYAVLQTANLGDLRPFIRYVAVHTKNTLMNYLALSSTHCIDCDSSQLTSDSPVIQDSHN